MIIAKLILLTLIDGGFKWFKMYVSMDLLCLIGAYTIHNWVNRND